MRRRRTSNHSSIEYKKTDFIEATLVDKVSLWILRIILKLNGHREFIDSNNNFRHENLVYFLGLGKYGEMDSEEYTRAQILNILKSDLAALEKQSSFSTSKILTKNIAQISNLMQLNRYEEEILEFTTLMKQYALLDDAVCLLGNELNSSQTKNALSVILNIPKAEIDKAFASSSKLSKSSLVFVEKKYKQSLENKLESISDAFLDNLLNLDEDISVMLKESVQSCKPSDLQLSDYIHLQKDMDILVPYLANSLKKRQSGVNILLYGLPGTGKTELAKVLAAKLKAALYEVSYTDEDDEPIDGHKRLKAYKSAQALLANKKTVLMYDEAEDIFESGGGFFAPPQRQKDKAWINRVLETNTIPTIWITNNISSIDSAIVRRFDISIELPIPPKSKREEIIKKYSSSLLDAQSIKQLAQNEDIAPALITSAMKVVNSIAINNPQEAFTKILNNTLKAQGYEAIKKENNVLPSLYNPEYINTTMDLGALALGIHESPNARLCLYGAPGTGKSAFGKYIADLLDKPILLKKGSDLISMYVGGTEKNIANAFREAKAENAVLVFDEVDSFLGERATATKSWEITQVNEMLVQMENFDGVFIATTNLMENLDKASLRRFDLKLEFNYLTSEQSWKIFLSYTHELKIQKPSSSLKNAVGSLIYLTPGDFAAVARQNRFRPLQNAQDLIQRLQDEIKAKKVSSENVIGFLK